MILPFVWKFVMWIYNWFTGKTAEDNKPETDAKTADPVVV